MLVKLNKGNMLLNNEDEVITDVNFLADILVENEKGKYDNLRELVDKRLDEANADFLVYSDEPEILQAIEDGEILSDDCNSDQLKEIVMEKFKLTEVKSEEHYFQSEKEIIEYLIKNYTLEEIPGFLEDDA